MSKSLGSCCYLRKLAAARRTWGRLCAALAILIGAVANCAQAAEPVGPPAPPASAVVGLFAPREIGIDPETAAMLAPPLYRGDDGRVSVMIVGRKTGAMRTTDTPAQLRKYRLYSVKAAIELRGAEDVHFGAKAKSLAQRLEDANPFAATPQLATVTTGAEFLDALVAASRRGPIANVAVFGHAAADALYMLEDRGFYAAVSDVAKSTKLAAGSDGEKQIKLRDLGARDLADLDALVKSGAIRFANNAVIVFTGCAVAGKQQIDFTGIAARVAEITGATTIASLDVTDQSMLFGQHVLEVFYSRGMWVKFAREAAPERLKTKRIDVLQYLNLDSSGGVATTPASVQEQTSSPEKYYCAAGVATAPGIDVAGFCGPRASNGDVVAQLRREEATPRSPM